MTKRSAGPGELDPDALPPIPDGGLSAGMPDWLRRPPAWRSLKESAGPAKAVPRPDTSPIDPRTILTVDDLPVWLQRIAASRAPGPAVEVGASPDVKEPTRAVPNPVVVFPNVVDETTLGSPGLTGSPALPLSVGTAMDDPVPRFVESPGPSGDRQWWHTGMFTALLFVALVIAVLIITLYATNVF
jgi:hypothetical protein